MVVIEEASAGSSEDDGVLVDHPSQTLPGLEPDDEKPESDGKRRDGPEQESCGCHGGTPAEIRRQQAAMAAKLLRRRKGRKVGDGDSSFADGSAEILEAERARRKLGSCGKIKWTQVFLMVIMFGPAVFPALLFAGESIAACAAGDVCPPVEFYNTYFKRPREQDADWERGRERGRSNRKKKPEDIADLRARLMQFYKRHAPSKATPGHVDKMLKKYKGHYKKLFKKLAKKYGV